LRCRASSASASIAALKVLAWLDVVVDFAALGLGDLALYLFGLGHYRLGLIHMVLESLFVSLLANSF
jgi:hypothetical protein